MQLNGQQKDTLIKSFAIKYKISIKTQTLMATVNVGNTFYLLSLVNMKNTLETFINLT